MPICVTARMQHALDLHGARSPWLRRTGRERQDVSAVTCPVAVLLLPLAGLVPALDKIVLDVRRRWPDYLDVDIVALATAKMARRSERSGSQINPANKGRFGRPAGIDHPALLVLAESGCRPIPTNPEARSTTAEHVPIRLRPGEGAAVATALRVRAPEKDAHIQTSLDGAVEHVEKRTAPVREAEVGREEGDGQPNAMARTFDRLADPLKGWNAIH